MPGLAGLFDDDLRIIKGSDPLGREEQKVEASGGFSDVTFQELKSSQLQHAALPSQALRVARSTFKKRGPEEGQVFQEQLADFAYDALREKEASGLSNAHYLRPIYQKGGVRVATAGTSDLLDFINGLKNRLREDQLRSIVGQLVICMEEFHRFGLVHRDLKPENILITDMGNGKYHVQVFDFDGLAKVDGRGFIQGTKEQRPPTFGTGDYLPPELVEEKRSKNGQVFFKADYARCDLRAGDCYALGRVLEELYVVSELYPGVGEDLSDQAEDFVRLATRLQRQDPASRYSMRQAMNHDFFGKNLVAREAFFEDLKKQFVSFKDDTYINSFLVRNTSEKGDNFYILPAKMQELILRLEELNKQNNYIQEYPADNDTLLTVLRKAEKVKKLIGEAMDDPAVSGYKIRLRGIGSKTDSLIIELKGKIQASAKPIPAALENITVDQLIATIQSAVNKYHAKVDKASFFASFLHGKPGKVRASAFEDMVKRRANCADRQEGKKVSDAVKLVEIFQCVLDHLVTAEGNWMKDSFKTILLAELRTISPLPLEAWHDYFLKQKNKALLEWEAAGGKDNAPAVEQAPPPGPGFEMKGGHH